MIDRYGRFIQEELWGTHLRSAPFISPSSVRLFGKEFFFPATEDNEGKFGILSLVDGIIRADEYHAKEYIKEDAVVIDAGANIGTFSVFAATRAPKGHVYAFEPAKDTFALLKKNTAGYPNITVINMGLGDAVAQRTIFDMGEGAGGSVFEDSPFYGDVSQKKGFHDSAAVVTLDGFAADHGLSRIDFIKIDTEGYERKILEGGASVLGRFHPIVSMSAYHNADDKEVLPAMMRAADSRYICKLYKDAEEDMVCYINE